VRLQTGNVDQYRSLMLLGYEESPAAFTSTLSERAALPRTWWENRLKSGAATGDIVFGACCQEVLAGAVGLSINNRTRTRHKATLFGMYVHPDFRGRGIATDLIDELLEYATTNPQLLELQLTVTENNTPARQLYQQKGFNAWGREPRAIAEAGGFLDKIHMRRKVD